MEVLDQIFLDPLWWLPWFYITSISIHESLPPQKTHLGNCTSMRQMSSSTQELQRSLLKKNTYIKTPRSSQFNGSQFPKHKFPLLPFNHEANVLFKLAKIIP